CGMLEGSAQRGARPIETRPAPRTHRRRLHRTTGDLMAIDLSTYSLTDDELTLAEGVRDFAERVVAPVSYEADRTKTLPMDVVAQMGEMGLFGIPFPEELGGQGGDYFALCLAIEALARVDQSIAITLEAG